MADVIPIRPAKAEKRVWVCACGCSTFTFYEDGTAECPHCGEAAETGGWEPPDQATDRPDDGPRQFQSIQGNIPDFAQHRIARFAGSEQATMLIIGMADGTVHTWAASEKADDPEWLWDIILRATRLLRIGKG